MEEMLRLFNVQCRPFVEYLKQVPHLERQASADVVIAFAVFHCLVDEVPVTMELLSLARDALLRLYEIAQSANFTEVSTFFHGTYETVCAELAKYS